MDRFQYIVRKYDNYSVSSKYVEKALDELGEAGWELVSVLRGNERYTECFFKRMIEERPVDRGPW